jgi:hypothetical protein
MRTLSIAAFLALSSMAGLMYAQGSPQRSEAEKRAIMAEFLKQRLTEQAQERDRELKTTCEMPDGSSHQLGAVTSYEGQTYRCVEALRSNGLTLTTYAAAWVKDSK